VHDIDPDLDQTISRPGESRLSVRHGIAGLRGWHGEAQIWVMIDCASSQRVRAAALDVLASRSELLLTAHAKHLELLEARESAIRALASIDRIETCLAASGMLTTRETEVCSRVIYGLSTLGIAVDLSLSEETVRTYRKRAYQRLALGTERQLLTWYLRQWTRWNARGVPRPST
jgi:DNA-binding NarL/FixJ family response regulator